MTEQEWKEKRLGCFSASEIWKLFVEPKSKSDKWSQTSITYIKEKACELLTGLSGGTQFENEAMKWGKQHERYAFDFMNDTAIDHYGSNIFKWIEYSDFSGSSPDGLKGNFTYYEAKCPFNSVIHLDHCGLKTGEDLKKYNKEYWYQLQFGMACLNKQTGENVEGCFISFDPRFKKNMLHTIYMISDKDFISALPEKIEMAEKELRTIIDPFL